MTFYIKDVFYVMERITNTTKNIVFGQRYITVNDVPVKLAIRPRFNCPAPSTFEMIDFQKRKYVTATVCTSSSTQPVYRLLPQLLVLLAPLSSLFFGVIATALFTTFTISNHVTPHIVAVLLLTFFGRSITILSLSHIGSITHNRMFESVRLLSNKWLYPTI